LVNSSCAPHSPAGRPGSNFADALAQNHDVVIIDNLATGPGWVNIEHLLDHPRVEVIEGSTADLPMKSPPGGAGIFSIPRDRSRTIFGEALLY